jgi:hypothetical protein
VLHSPTLSGSTGASRHGARFFAERLTLLSEGNDTVAARVLQEQNTFGILKGLLVGAGGDNAAPATSPMTSSMSYALDSVQLCRAGRERRVQFLAAALNRDAPE